MKKPKQTGAESVGATSARKNVLIVDDHPFMRAGLAQLINRQHDLVVCGEAGDPGAAMAELKRIRGALSASGCHAAGKPAVTSSPPWRRASPAGRAP